MTTAAHTPGPWRFIYRGVDQTANWVSRIPYAIERVVGNAVLPVADVCDQPQAEANARLSAAAPELLAALQRLIASQDAHNSLHAADGDDYARMFEHGQAYDEARLLVAKATGADQ